MTQPRPLETRAVLHTLPEERQRFHRAHTRITDAGLEAVRGWKFISRAIGVRSVVTAHRLEVVGAFSVARCSRTDRCAVWTTLAECLKARAWLDSHPDGSLETEWRKAKGTN